MIIPSLFAILIVVVDQLIKLMIRSQPVGNIFFSAEPLAEIVYYSNTGAAFSMLSGKTSFLAVLSVLLLAFIFVFVSRKMRLTPIGMFAFSGLYAGGVSNLIDRILFGEVTDYIKLLFVRFPVFNLADMAIVISVFVIVILMATGKLEMHTGE